MYMCTRIYTYMDRSGQMIELKWCVYMYTHTHTHTHLFCHILGLFCHILGLFYHILGLFTIYYFSFAIYQVSFAIYQVSFAIYQVSFAIYQVSFAIYQVSFTRSLSPYSQVSFAIFQVSFAIYQVSFATYQVSFAIFTSRDPSAQLQDVGLFRLVQVSFALVLGLFCPIRTLAKAQRSGLRVQGFGFRFTCAKARRSGLFMGLVARLLRCLDAVAELHVACASSKMLSGCQRRPCSKE